MYPAEVLGAAPSEKVLDLCAALGGKTTQLAGMMDNKGLLIANEIDAKRAKALSENIERLGITNCIVMNETPERLAARFPGYFDRILLDVPCSGEGMFRKDPAAITYWSEAHGEACARVQSQLFEAALNMLREGGKLVYSTCTFSLEENEQQVAAYLQKYPELELIGLSHEYGVAPGVEVGGDLAATEPTSASRRNLMSHMLSQTARLWPHRLRGEGHYAALLHKRGAGANSAWKGIMAEPSVSRQAMQFYRIFEQQTLQTKLEGTFHLQGTQLFLLPEGCPELAGLRLVRPGLHLGELKKGRFEPNHALARVLTAEQFVHTHELATESEDRISSYLRGETLLTDGDRGWLAITYRGFPIGWGKETQGIIKNFYPKGLRLP